MLIKILIGILIFVILILITIYTLLYFYTRQIFIFELRQSGFSMQEARKLWRESSFYVMEFSIKSILRRNE